MLLVNTPVVQNFVPLSEQEEAVLAGMRAADQLRAWI